MANIRQYDSPVDKLAPSIAGAEATARAGLLGSRTMHQAAVDEGTAIERAGRDVAGGTAALGESVVNYLDHTQISQGAAVFADKQQQIIQAWNDTAKNSNINDPTVAQNFREKVLEPELQKFKEGFYTEKGQDWAEHHIEKLRDHMYHKMTADMSSRAGAATKENLLRTANSLTNAAYTDPTSVPYLIGSADHTVDGMVNSSPNLTEEARNAIKGEIPFKLKEKIVQAGVTSAIQNSSDPEKTAMEWTKKYPEYINGAEANTLAKSARTQIKFNEAQDKAANAAQKEIDKDNADKFGANLVSSIIKPDGTFAPAGPEYFKNLREAIMPGPNQLPGMTATKAMELFKFGTTESENRVSEPNAKIALQQQLYQGNLDPIDIIKAANEGKISHADAGILEGQRKMLEEHPVKDPLFTAAMHGAQASIVVPTNYSDFLQTFLPQYMKAKADGTLKPGDLNFNDPNSMISKSIADHQPPLEDRIQFQATKNIQPSLVPDAGKGANNAEVKPEEKPKEITRLIAGVEYVNRDGKWFKK